MAKALYGHLARPAIEAQLIAEIARLRARVAHLEAENARLESALATALDPSALDPAALVTAPDDLADLPDLARLGQGDPAFA